MYSGAPLTSTFAIPLYTHCVASVATNGTTPSISIKKPFITPVRTPIVRQRIIHSHIGSPIARKLTIIIPDSAIDAPALRSLPPQTRQNESPQPMIV